MSVLDLYEQGIINDNYYSLFEYLSKQDDIEIRIIKIGNKHTEDGYETLYNILAKQETFTVFKKTVSILESEK